MAKNVAVKVGDLIRVRRAEYHNIKFGALVRVLNISTFNSDMLVTGPCRYPWAVTADGSRDSVDDQYVEMADVLHIAKERKV